MMIWTVIRESANDAVALCTCFKENVLKLSVRDNGSRNLRFNRIQVFDHRANYK